MSMKLFALGAVVSGMSFAQASDLNTRVDRELDAIAPRIIEWRRDFHRNPELSNREFRTSKIVAEHLRKLGLEVETGVARTGVLGLLRGGKPGVTIAMRADMDGLPVTEQTDVPFKSTRTDTYNGNPVGVMHACGHDGHTSILMGVAEALTKVRADLPGNVLFIFQPAEEGAPAGEEGGAPLMLKEGVFEKYKPEVAFGLHLMSALKAYRRTARCPGSVSIRS
jgi:amidohydrolase